MSRRQYSITGMVAAAGLALAGCAHPGQAPLLNPHTLHNAPPVDGDVPRELCKVTLPPYVIEPPDRLLIEVVTITEEEDEGGVADKPKGKRAVVRDLPVQPVRNEFQVHPDGTVYLGIWGSVPVAGLTKEQAAEAVRQKIASKEVLTLPGTRGIKPETIYVVLDVTAYASKVYYVITDGGGAGEQVVARPIVGSETVADAIAAIGGLPPVASRRDVWVARRAPGPGMPEQILPVDWVGLTQYGIAATNYQVMPGDRIYVKAQRIVTVDTTLARIISPFERLFGVTLLGASTVNQIQGRGSGFGNNP
jgi:polysaccharide export outer membrane protein